MMGKIKCYSNIECETCHTKGMLQAFLNRENQPKYGRIRHSQRIAGKAVFSYHSQSLSYINQKISFNLCNGDPGQKDVSLGQSNSSSVLGLEPSAGFGPATITLPR